jgi:hypothetical protein
VEEPGLVTEDTAFEDTAFEDTARRRPGDVTDMVPV